MYSILRIPPSDVNGACARRSQGIAHSKLVNLNASPGASGLFLGRFLPQLSLQIIVVRSKARAYDGTLIVASTFSRTPVFLSTEKVQGKTHPSAAVLIPLSYCSE